MAARRENRSSATSYEVTIGSRKFSQPERDGVQMLVVEDHVDMVDMLTLKIGGAEKQPAWDFKIGDPVECKLGQGTEAVFKGEVTALEPGFQVEGTSSLTIRALDHMHRLGRGRFTRFWEKRLDSQVVEEVGSECQLAVTADETTQLNGYILQRNESNVGFLKRLAARNNFILRVEGDSLVFKKASFEGESKVVEMGDNLRSMRMAYNSVDMVQKVVVRGWDPKRKMEVVGTATTGELMRIGGGELGADVAGCFGESTAYLTDIPVTNQLAATQIALSELERMARQFCRGSASVQGDDKVRAGTMVNFSGLSTGYNGKYFVLATRHIISNRSGYTTELTFCSNTMGN